MKRRPITPTISLAVAAASLTLLACCGCGSMKFWCWGCGSSADDAKVYHIVLVWLKLPGNPTHRNQVIELAEVFEDIRGVREVRAGRSIPSKREIVDDSFDVAIVMAFDDKFDLQSYIDHPDHQQAVKDTLAPLADRIVVHDFILPY